MSAPFKAPEIERRFWGLAALLSPPRTPEWLLGPVTMSQALKQRAFGLRFKLDVSLSLEKGRAELSLNLEPLPRSGPRDWPEETSKIGAALERLGYRGEWDSDPGHAAANGTWRRTVSSLEDAALEVGFVQQLGTALEDGSVGRSAAPAQSSEGVPIGAALLKRLRAKRIGELVAHYLSFERTIPIDVGGARRSLKIEISSMSGTLYKSAFVPFASGKPSARAQQELALAVKPFIGNAKGSWIDSRPPLYCVLAPMRSLEVAERYADSLQRAPM